jgi:hypothetical protein
MIEEIAAACPVMSVRYLDNYQNEALLEELVIHGAHRVPVVVTLSEDFFEVGRFGDYPLSVYRRRMETLEGGVCSVGFVPPREEALCVELSEWVEYFERQQYLLRLSPMLRERYGD